MQNQKKTLLNPFKQDEEDGSEYTVVSYEFNCTGYQEAFTGTLAADTMFAVTV